MGRGMLFPAEIEQLRENPYVLFVDKDRVAYTNQFKMHFMKEYLSGKGPTQIFRESGFDPKILGSKRIERAAARWKESYTSASLKAYPNAVARRQQGVRTTSKRSKDLQKQLLEKQNKIDELQAQVDLLKAMIPKSIISES